MRRTQATLTPARRPGPRRGALDLLVLGIAGLTVLVGAYGMYDLVMAPPTTASSPTARGNTPERRGTGGLLLGGMELCPGKNQVNILIMGCDEGPRTDTLLVVMIRKDTRRAAVLSIPRDLMVKLPGHGIQKINAVYTFNFRKGTGGRLASDTIGQILTLPVDYYIATDVDKFPKLFDAFGGLDIYVDREMQYHDSWGHLDINLHPGLQHLNGNQIEQFVRHRHQVHGRNSTDYERNQRQQYVLKELVKQKGNLASATRLPQIVYALHDMLDTDMTIPELVALGLLVRRIDTSQVISRLVPSHAYMNVAWYAILEPEGTRKVMQEIQAGLAGAPVPRDNNPERNPHIGGGELNTAVGTPDQAAPVTGSQDLAKPAQAQNQGKATRTKAPTKTHRRAKKRPGPESAARRPTPPGNGL